MSEEQRQTSPTGGSKGQKMARYDLIPAFALNEVARQFGRGALKYEDRNWERGYDWSLSYQAAMRHLVAWWSGEDLDPDYYWESVQVDPPHHLDAAIFHLLALREFDITHPEYDNRPGRET